jgi:HK97 family phage portal protein
VSLLTRLTGLFGAAKSAPEGQYREGPYLLPYSGGWLSAEAGSYMNWWQMGHDVQSGGTSAMVEACVSAYSQTLAMCPGNHWKLGADGGRVRVGGSALARVLRRPNSYQSISDFLLNATRSLFLEGNVYALALRNDRNEISELHLMDPRKSSAQLSETGEIFYRLAGNEIIDRQIGEKLIVPARDVLHVRLHTPCHPLKGETPIMATALQTAAGNAALAQQLQFFMNQARPSFVLSTDQILTAEQVAQLRERWNEQSKGMNSGGTPILTAGLKAQPLGVSAQDSQLIEVLKLSNESIATVMRVPLTLVGQATATFASTEALMQFWLASGLGFVLNHFEEAIGNLFRLYGQPDEYVEFDTGALLRSAYKDRIEALAAGVIGGLLAPDEARADLELAKVPGGFGQEPRVQQQVVPLSAWELTAEPAAPAAPAPPAAAANDDAEEARAQGARNFLDGLKKGLA